MTENNTAPQTVSFTQEEIDAAQNAEQLALQEATNTHLQNRVVTLRALVNKLQADLEEARMKLEAHELYLEGDEEDESSDDAA